MAVFNGAWFTVTRVAFSPDGELLAYTSYDRDGSPSLRLVNVTTRKYLAGLSVDPLDRDGGASGACFNTFGDRVAAYSLTERVIRVWTVDSILKHGK